MTAPALVARDLRVDYDTPRGPHTVVHGIDLTLAPGRTVALVGESGSGKSTTGRALIGLLPRGGRISGGEVLLAGTDISGWSDRRLDAVRGTRIGLVPQDPAQSLDPVTRIGDSIGAALRRAGVPRAQVKDRVLAALESVHLPDPAARARQYPHELSGGMRQRVLIARAVALDPQVIIADEPTSALDVTVQRSILELLDELRERTGAAVLFITHDLALAADHADEVVVLAGGRVQESGRAAQVLRAPSAAYTRKLIADAPSLTTPLRPAPPAAPPVLEVRDLRQEFRLGSAAFAALDGVSLDVARGSTHAVVGESGSGKTTLARAVLGLRPATGGTITLAGTDLASVRGRDRRELRRRAQLVWQNPHASFDPRRRLREAVTDPLRNTRRIGAAERSEIAAAAFEQVSLDPALIERRPGELSGGQLQRAAIARALVLEPELLVLDEPTSALDVTVQAQILELLARLQDERGLSYLFISHDLAVVRSLAHTVTVLHRGKVVETGPVGEIFDRPTDTYTRALIDAIPGRNS